MEEEGEVVSGAVRQIIIIIIIKLACGELNAKKNKGGGGGRGWNRLND
jgi:hypothetical protein